MGIRRFRPVTSTLRHTAIADFAEITKGKPEKNLLRPLKSSGGRNMYGRITSRYRGGGHKRMYRLIDFKRDRIDQECTVLAIEYDPNRTARIALIQYPDKVKSYILAPLDLKPGDKVISTIDKDVEIKPGIRRNGMQFPGLISTSLSMVLITLSPGFRSSGARIYDLTLSGYWIKAMRAVRFGSYSIAKTVHSWSMRSLLKSMRRYIRLCPP